MNIFIGGLIIFIIVVLVVEMSTYAYKTMQDPDHRLVRKRLKTLADHGAQSEDLDILKNTTFSDIALINKVLSHTPGVYAVQRLANQANAQYPVGYFVMLAMILSLGGYLTSVLITRNFLISSPVAIFLATLPFMYLRLKRKKRIAKFERQLPDALDLIARALRAGQAFTSGLKLAADEFDDPLGPEFEYTIERINFGISISDALKNLAERVDCPDLKYFIVSVILQRETGGNLAEIIEGSARIIRERFKLQGKIKVLSAEGRLSATILIGLPFVVVLVLRIVNPQYINTLFSEPAGRITAGVAAFIMAVGVVVIKSMIRIKV